MKFTDTVRRVIELGAASREYWNRELRKRHPNYPILTPGTSEDDIPPPPEQTELWAFLRALPPEQVYRLIALMYLGREDFPAAEYEEQVRHMPDAFPVVDWAIGQMVEKAPLADYLADGLSFAEDTGVVIDHPAATPA